MNDGSSFGGRRDGARRSTLTIAEHIASYLDDLDTADRHEGDGVEARSVRLVEKIDSLRAQMAMLKVMEAGGASPLAMIAGDPHRRRSHERLVDRIGLQKFLERYAVEALIGALVRGYKVAGLAHERADILVGDRLRQGCSS